MKRLNFHVETDMTESVIASASYRRKYPHRVTLSMSDRAPRSLHPDQIPGCLSSWVEQRGQRTFAFGSSGEADKFKQANRDRVLVDGGK